MIIKKRKIILLSLLSLVISNFFLVMGINPFFLGTIFSFFTYLVLPGILFVSILNIKQISFWEYLFIFFAISISFLEFGGLIINQLLPLFGIHNPLSLGSLLIVFNFYLTVILLVTWKKNRGAQFIIPKLKVSKRNLWFVLPLLFPMLAVFGAFSINNNGSNALTLLLLFLIGIFTFLVTYFRKTIPDNLLPFTLFFMSLSLLLTTSMRGWIISGHDIQREYYVFLLTKNHSLWDISFYKDAYNACLSITILPTVLAHLLGIKDIYVYKVIYQILFSICPVMIYYILQRYTSRISAFLSAFYFISFPTFFNDMPMLTRQEIGFIFFGLLLYITLLPNFSLKIRKMFFFILGFSIIVSHYSTNYVVLAIFSGMLVLSTLAKNKQVKRITFGFARKVHVSTRSKFENNPFVNYKMLFILILLTVFWNTAFTKTSNNVGDVASKVVNGIFLKSTNESKSVDVSYSLFSGHKKTDEEIFSDYVKANIARAKKIPEGPFYENTNFKLYPTRSMPSDSLPLTGIGKIFVSLHIPISKLQSLSRQESAVYLQVFVFLGILIILLGRKRERFDKEYVFLCVSGVMLLASMILLPTLSVEYGLLRLFLQLLFILSLTIIITSDAIFRFIPESKRVLLISSIAILFFLNLTGFISHVTGAYTPQMTLDNGGIYYNALYVKQSDVSASSWLGINKLRYAPVQSDASDTTKLLLYGNIQALREIFPEIIRQNAYVFLTNSTIKDAIVSSESDVFIFTSPEKFLSNNKNLIYNNGSNKIYK